MKLSTRRMSLLASGALALSVVAAPVVAAEPSADDPLVTITTLLDTIVAKDFAGIEPLICAERRADMMADLDLSQSFAGMPEGVDVQALIDGLILATPDRQVTLISNDGTLAIVDVVATLTIAIDDAAATVFITQLLEAQGMDVTEEMVAMALPQLQAQFGEGEELTDQVEVILEDGAWRVCDDLGDDAEASPEASADPAASPAMPMASPEASPAA